ncbi:Hsp20/alpha crystallin family protein [Anoxybacillus rupiensis]|jgi:HSP20 family protein|uniref:Hsp20/alpha crystallin family protein n=1 Tax=Anoxybacteroides rupiense TaxID=311460 RepID=A0ABD5IW86_9BACL|nr:MULTISPECIES: Hsp20/alpha crystallin family protein [Anoxybacillus]KXG10980.1 Spore protein SP21 [Anoxybacillus sp. P3H1B]MBS2770317.1 Hsp20/alpha crystallin family protein [Anoxybacillus rupiensis]MDE8562304.1 Hsp20/alpha crystallin family protein [Anoxybacillus rupiensis]MED5051934.1 Hsp20/alpha crystallin family protein [Anoxybacillus rupiensis]QHC04500.1 Hsp20 family protein [Anoxybacillus sp. PDR2]
MPLVPYDPFRHLETMRRDFNRLFARDFSSLFPDSEAMMPRVDMHETDKEYMISCDLPGLERKEDVHINVHQQTLHISGTIQRDESVKEEQMHRRERFFGRFHRSIPLPSDADAEQIRATYKNGVLNIHVPKTNNQQRKSIDIQFH